MSEQKTLAIMFADVRGSTRLYEKYGDVRGRELTAWSVKVFCDSVAAEGGTVIKTMGDGAMATFPTASQALNAATQVQEKHETAEVAVGIGFQTGHVIYENGDVFGDAVNVAARLCSLAKAGEILTTDEAVRQFPAFLRNNTRHIDTTTVKGKREEIKIFQVLWNQNEEQTVTIMPGGMGGPAPIRREASMTISYEGRSFRLGHDTESFEMGRLQGNLVVPDSLVSRNHAKIEFRRGKFILSDISTNGTFVLYQHGGESVLRREEVELTDSGWIGLGRPATADNPHRITFTVTTAD